MKNESMLSFLSSDKLLGMNYIPPYNTFIDIFAWVVYRTTIVELNIFSSESIAAATLKIWAFEAVFTTVSVVPFYYPSEHVNDLFHEYHLFLF